MSKYWDVQPYKMYILFHLEKDMLKLVYLELMHCTFGKIIHQNCEKIGFFQLGRYPFSASIIEGKKALLRSEPSHFVQLFTSQSNKVDNALQLRRQIEDNTVQYAYAKSHFVLMKASKAFSPEFLFESTICQDTCHQNLLFEKIKFSSGSTCQSVQSDVSLTVY